MNNLKNIQKSLNDLANKEKAKVLQRFFKTNKGEYGYGDVFLGITVPVQRQIAKKYKDISFIEIKKLLENKIHEYRLTALEILNFKYEKAVKENDNNSKLNIVKFYLKNKKYINNWDLVDTSAPYILGDYLVNDNRDIRHEKNKTIIDRSILYKLANSNNIWDKRLSIISTFAFIKNNDFRDTIAISKILLHDKHNLIHKAVGWMLREVGKRSKDELINFLNKYYKVMPRTMLRYSIEKLEIKNKYLR